MSFTPRTPLEPMSRLNATESSAAPPHGASATRLVFTAQSLKEARALIGNAKKNLEGFEQAARLRATPLETVALPSALATAPAVLGDWTELPGNVAVAYVRLAETRPRPLWFHLLGIAALVCAVTRPAWSESEPR